ncbi:MAG: Na+/H+ antiporter subunit E [Sedimentisphaerales bacterium]|nr:Na+/H+ antiporter subunit E [Sedimentisphaerales bacterium]
MSQTARSAREKVKGFAWLLVITFALWLALISKLDWPELVCGGLVCLIISLFGAGIYSKLGLPPLNIKRLLFSLVYIIVLFWEIIKANFDVAYRVVHPKMPIKPGIVIIKTSLKSDIGKLILANSITLTPGTFTLDVIGDKLLIHWINVKAEDIDEATNMIGQRFEKYLRVIFS